MVSILACPRRPAFVVPVILVACSGGGGSPTAPNPTPPPISTSARFTVVSNGESRTVEYAGDRNLILCTRNAGWASLFVRLAEQRSGNGESGPHVDLDLCNHPGGGSFSPKDPTSTSCAGGKVFDLWWHGGDGAVFVNDPRSPCALQLVQDGTRLNGTFDCRGLVERGGARRLDIVGGSFECTES